MLTISSNPHDYGLPSDTWYAHQTEMVGAAVNLPYHGILVIEGPCGTGKSFAPATVSHFRPGTTVIVGTRDLQSQYADTLDFAIVWGQEHYPCAWDERVKDYSSTYGCDPTRADCPFRKPSAECTHFLSCPYENAKALAYGSSRIVLNVAYAYHTNWWRMGRTNWDLFLDEAHRMPEELSNLISVTVSKWVRKHYELPEFPEITESGEKRQKAIRTAYDWLGRCVALMTRWCNVRDEQKALKAKRFQANLKQLQDVLGDAQPGMWYIQSNAELFSAKPVVPGIYANKLIANQARSLTLMSATIGDADTLLDELGLGDMEYQFISLPHAFPQENRPVLWVQSAPRMRNRTTEAEYKYQAQLISGIIQQHKGEKGLIHTASWHHAKALMEYLSNNGVGDRMMLAEGNRIETVEQFKLSAPGTVAVSPSWREGLNFPDDECRFAIVAKCFTSDVSLLGPDGEITIENAEVGTPIFSFANGELVIDRIESIYVQPYQGPIYNYKGEEFDFSVTPNHDLLVSMHKKYHRWEEIKKVEARDLTGRLFRIPLIATWSTNEKPPSKINIHSFIPSTARVYYDAPARKSGSHNVLDLPDCFIYDRNTRMYVTGFYDLPDEWYPNPERKCYITERPQSIRLPWDFDFINFMKLMGWFITEGHLFHSAEYTYSNGRAGEVWGVGITQNMGRNLDEIRKVLNDLNIQFSESPKSPDSNTMSIRINSIALHSALAYWCGANTRTKRIPKFLLGYGKDSLRILFDVLIAGDGSIRKSGGYVYSTSSKQLKYDVIELGYKLGYQPRIINTKHDNYMISFASHRTKGEVDKHKQSVQDYSGFVWCVETTSGTVLAGRNGKWAFTGNCPFLSLTDPIIRMRLAQDGGNRWYKWKAALQVVQALGRGVRHADDWCINYIVDGTWPQVAPYVPKWFHVDTI